MKLKRRIYPGIRLLESVAYAKDVWIDLFIRDGRLGVQFIILFTSRLSLWHIHLRRRQEVRVC